MSPDLLGSCPEISSSLVLLVSFVAWGRYGRRCLRKLSVTELPRMFASALPGAESTESPARWPCQRGIDRLAAGGGGGGGEKHRGFGGGGAGGPAPLSRAA